MRWTDEDWWDQLERERQADKRVVRIGAILVCSFTTGALAPWHLLPWNQ